MEIIIAYMKLYKRLISCGWNIMTIFKYENSLNIFEVFKIILCIIEYKYLPVRSPLMF